MSEEQLTRFIAERQNEQDEFETFTAANGYALPNWSDHGTHKGTGNAYEGKQG